MRQFKIVQEKVGQHLAAELERKGVNFAVRFPLKAKVGSSTSTIPHRTLYSSIFRCQQFHHVLPTRGKSALLRGSDFHGLGGCILSSKMSVQFSSFQQAACRFPQKSETEMQLLQPHVRHESSGSSGSRHQGKGSKSSSVVKSLTDRGVGGYVGVAVVVVAGFVVYLLSGCRQNSDEEEARCQGQELPVLKMSKGGKPLSLQEAIVQATDLCQRVKDESGSPGLVVAVTVDGQLVWTQGMGYADIENRLPCKADTVMRIASISKPITMAAVAKAMEKGDLDLDKPVQHYVPQFPEKWINGEKVVLTTRHLVSHLGGVRHYSKGYIKNNAADTSSTGPTTAVPASTGSTATVPVSTNPTTTVPASTGSATTVSASTGTTSTVASKKKNPFMALRASKEFEGEEYYLKDKFHTTQEALALFKDDPLVHKPGSKFLYTSHGWTLIAAVLEGATKCKYPQLIRNLFRDLGLENTYLDDNEPLIYNRSRYYVRNKKGLLVNAPYVDCSYKYAGGGMLSTAGDLAHFGDAMLYSYQRPHVSDATQQSDKGANSLAHQDKTVTSIGLQHSNTSSAASAAGVCQRSLPGYLEPSTMTQVWSPVKSTQASCDKDALYAMGWAVVPEKQTIGFGRRQRFYVSHTGGAIGASSVLLILPTSSSEDVTKGGNKGLATTPQGVTVAIIVNLISVSLSKTALDIAKVFERASLD